MNGWKCEPMSFPHKTKKNLFIFSTTDLSWSSDSMWEKWKKKKISARAFAIFNITCSSTWIVSIKKIKANEERDDGVRGKIGQKWNFSFQRKERKKCVCRSCVDGNKCFSSFFSSLRCSDIFVVLYSVPIHKHPQKNI
jgi:hypothetical protein